MTTIRLATIEDIPEIQALRLSVRENVLSDPSLITNDDYREYLTVRGKGWVCELDNKITGFAIIDLKDNNIWALFVLPEFEKKGIGKRLHSTMLDWYFSQSADEIWLGTSPNTRAEKFYRRAGWKEAGTHGKGEIKFTMRYAVWIQRDQYIGKYTS